MNLLLGASYIALAFVQLLTYAAVVTRHAVPRSPFPFHVALTPFMLGGVVILMILGAGAVAEADEVWGVSILGWRTARLWTEVAWLTILLYYAFWHFTHARNNPEVLHDRAVSCPEEEDHRAEGLDRRSEGLDRRSEGLDARAREQEG